MAYRQFEWKLSVQYTCKRNYNSYTTVLFFFQFEFDADHNFKKIAFFQLRRCNFFPICIAYTNARGLFVSISVFIKFVSFALFSVLFSCIRSRFVSKNNFIAFAHSRQKTFIESVFDSDGYILK